MPGFQPFAAYDVVLANLVPGTERREPPRERRGGARLDRHAARHARRSRSSATSPAEDARERLGHVAVEQHVGFDGFWTLPGA